MINKTFFLYTKLKIKELVLVIVNKNQRVSKKKLVFIDNKYAFDVDITTADYLYFFIDNKKSDIIYPDSITNTYELKFNKEINSYEISLCSINNKMNYKNYFYYANSYKEIIKKKQKVTIYKSSNIKSKNCGLIISFDGQNVFYKGKYKKSNIYNGVQLDIVADILSSKYNKDYIILAIDNASLHRSKELTMSNKFAPIVHDKIKNYKKEFNSSYLESYMEFIINDIITDIINKYNIDKNNIGIIGASSGGLASFYSILKYPDIFSFALCLSPAFPLFKKEDIISFYKKQMQNKVNKNKIYLYSGNISKLEKDICTSTLDIYNEIKDNTNLFLRINSSAKHNEIAWRLAIVEGIKKVLELED